MKRRGNVFVVSIVFLSTMFLVNTLMAGQEGTCKPSNEEVVRKTQKLHMPFIANLGQVDERVKFYANTFGGTVFVTKNGEIIYSLPCGGNANSIMNFGSSCSIHKAIFETFWIVPQLSNPPFVTKNLWEPQRKPPKGLALKEEMVNGKISEIKGEGISETKVNYFGGKYPSQWKSNISTYASVTLGEVYEEIDVKLKAGNGWN